MLSVIANQATIANCQRTLKRSVAALADEKRVHDVGYPGGIMRNVTIHYVQDLDFWMCFESAQNRFWNACGIGNPFRVAAPAPHLEINFPYSGIDRRIAGVFLEDESGVHYVGHSGKVGGGTTGVSPTNFVEFYPGTTTVRSGDKDVDVFVLAPLKDEDLGAKLAHFTSISAEFRASIKLQSKRQATGPTKQPALPTFNPEFIGKKTYATAERVEAEATHGTIVKALRDRLADAKLVAGNTTARDLYVVGPKGAIVALFEVKTLANTTSIYGCLGQLLFHGGSGAAQRLIAVLPAEVTSLAVARLERLGVDVVTFSYRPGGEPAFNGLDEVIRQILGP